MKRTNCFILILLLLLQGIFYTSCSKSNRYSRDSFEYFDTVVTITGYADSREEFDKICDNIFTQIEEYHRLFDIYNSYDGMNNINSLNAIHDGTHKKLTVDKKIIDLLLFSKDIYKKTDGKVNIAMGSVLSIWHTYRTNANNAPSSAHLPSMQELSEASAHTDIDRIEIDQNASTVFLSDSKMTLDVGAVAKGYTAEQIALYLKEKSISGYALNLGGNVRTIGSPPNGDGWETVVEHPFKKGIVASLKISDSSLVTSGNQHRFFTVNEKKYHHIIDTKTLMPAEYGFASVSVLTENSATADALSTALFCMNCEDGKKLLKNFGDAEALWVYNDGKLDCTDKFKPYISK